jgi:hypothetical protein
MAQVKPKSWTPGLASNVVAGTIPSLMVLVTRAPTSTAPANSIIAAARHACRSVRDFDETDAVKEMLGDYGI